MTTEQKRAQIRLALKSGFMVKISSDGYGEVIALGFYNLDYQPNILISDYDGSESNLIDLGACSIKSFKIIPRPQYKYKVGDKVKVIYKRGSSTYGEVKVGKTYSVGQMDLTGVNVEVSGTGLWVPQEWLCPVVEDEPEETIEIAGKKYSKKEFETAVKDLKEIK